MKYLKSVCPDIIDKYKSMYPNRCTQFVFRRVSWHWNTLAWRQYHIGDIPELRGRRADMFYF